MKYRYLTYHELALLKDDFLHFLYSEGVSNYEYKLLQDQYSVTALKLLGKYSDQTFDKIMQEVEYLEFRTSKLLKVMHFTETEFITLGIKVPFYSQLDLTDVKSLQECQEDLVGFKCFKHVTPYFNNRESDIFQLIESGSYVVDSHLYEQLKIIRQTYEN